jgi:hypothetical protein
MTWTSSPSTLSFDAPVRTARRSAIRLTRRGRLVVLLGVLALVLVAFTLGRTATSQAATSSPAAAPYAQTTVHEGESLWAVAKRVAPRHDPRAVVQQIRELNHLDSASVRAGQQLLLPRRA